MAKLPGQEFGNSLTTLVDDKPNTRGRADLDAWRRGPAKLVRKQLKQRNPTRHEIRDRGGKQR